MIKGIYLMLFLLSFGVVKAQIDQCEIARSVDSLITKDFSFEVTVSGKSLLKYKESGASLFITPWFTGYDKGGNLKMSNNMKSMSDSIGYFAGPLKVNIDNSNKEICDEWDRIFRVTKDDIALFKVLQNAKVLSLDNIPDNILYWPGNSNPYLEIAYNDKFRSSARFYDYNVDGIYDPLDGDMPITFGSDEMIYRISNLHENIRKVNSPRPITKVVKQYSFVYKHEDSHINKTVYNIVEMKMLPWEDVYKAYTGLFIDYNSSNNKYDSFGTISDKDATYYFNDCWKYNDCIDKETKDSSIILVQVLQAPLFHSRDTIVTMPLGSTIDFREHIDSMDYKEVYNKLKGHWSDDTPLTYGGDGYNIGSIDTINFKNNDLSSDTTEWTECNTPQDSMDLAVLMNYGPRTIRPSESNYLSYAITLIDDAVDPCEDLNSVHDVLDKVKKFFKFKYYNDSNIKVENEMLNFEIFPNPANDYLVIVNEYQTVKEIRIYNDLGRKEVVPYRGSSKYSTLDISHKPAGMYYFQFVFIDGMVITKKVIVQ